MDIQEEPKLALFACYSLTDEIVKELLITIPLSKTTRGVDIEITLLMFDAPMLKLVTIATDGAPIGNNASFIGLLRIDTQIQDSLPIHHNIHSNGLVGEFFSYKDVIRTILRINNCIHSNLP